MAFYKNLGSYQKFNGTDQQTGQSGKEKADWIARHLLLMRRHLIGDLADQMAEENNTGHLGRTKAKNLVIGSWNIRAFDDGDPRLDESYHYIAEIIDKFDICAVQEIKSDLAPLKRLMSLLGPEWDYLVTDVVEGEAIMNAPPFSITAIRCAFVPLSAKWCCPIMTKFREAMAKTGKLHGHRFSLPFNRAGFASHWCPPILFLAMIWPCANRN